MLREFLSQLGEKVEDGKNPRSILFYTSPYERARQTCKGIIEGIKDLEGVEYKVNEEPRMREQDFGNFQSTPEEMESIWEQRAFYGHFFYRIPHGESAADVYDRVSSFNETLFRQFLRDSFPNVLVLVTHGIWARVFLMKWFRWSYEEFESLRNIPHCQFLLMKQGEDLKYQLKTPLRTWDELPDADVENEIRQEFVLEVCFNTKNKLANPEDLDIASILAAQTKAIRGCRSKDQEIKHAYAECMNKYNSRLSKFKESNQSVASTAEDTPSQSHLNA